MVGGGAAGFFAAITCAEAAPDTEVMVLERSPQFLTKVRISGGGRKLSADDHRAEFWLAALCWWQFQISRRDRYIDTLAGHDHSMAAIHSIRGRDHAERRAGRGHRLHVHEMECRAPHGHEHIIADVLPGTRDDKPRPDDDGQSTEHDVPAVAPSWAFQFEPGFIETRCSSLSSTAVRSSERGSPPGPGHCGAV